MLINRAYRNIDSKKDRESWIFFSVNDWRELFQKHLPFFLCILFEYKIRNDRNWKNHYPNDLHLWKIAVLNRVLKSEIVLFSLSQSLIVFGYKKWFYKNKQRICKITTFFRVNNYRFEYSYTFNRTYGFLCLMFYVLNKAETIVWDIFPY